MKIIDPIKITDSVLFATNVAENEYPIYQDSGVYGLGERIIVVAEHMVYQQLRGTTATVTISIANPAVVTWSGHGLTVGKAVKFSTTGALPAGLVAGVTYYVVAVTATTFSVSATLGGAAIATTGSQSGVHSAISNDVGQTPASSPLYWQPVGMTNTWKMFDAYANTQTVNADSISVTLKPSSIITGVYLSVEADSVDIQIVDPIEGTVYSRTESLIRSNSHSSFWNWSFKRIARRNVFIAIDLPPYVGVTVYIRINRPGALAKCGMCSIGPLLDSGLSKYGITTEIKDYSTTTFDVEGNSETVERGFSKRMTLDIELDNDVIDDVQDMLAERRQKPMVFIGMKASRWTAIYGKYNGLKNVIENFSKSRLAMTIDGMTL